MSILSRPVRLSLALLGLTHFAAPILAHADRIAAVIVVSGKPAQTGLAVDAKTHPASTLPPFRTPEAHIETFNTVHSVTYQPSTRVDPIQGEVKGVPLGGKVEVRALGEPKAITLPEGELRRAAGPTDVRKMSNRSYNREVAKQVALAQSKHTIFQIEPGRVSASADTNAAVPYSGKTLKIENEPVTVAARTPLDVTVTDKFGRAKTMRREAVGAVRETTSASAQIVMNHQYATQTSTTDKGGELAGTMKPPVQQANLRVSRPYFLPGDVERRNPMVKVLSLGAFAGNNATVKVVNRETGAEVQMTKISSAGGGSVAIPAMRKADLRLVVEYPAVDKRSVAAKTVYDFQAPDYSPGSNGHRAAFEKVAFTPVE